MLTEVMQHYGLARPPVDAGFFETEHHAQVARDIQAAIMRGGLIALTAILKTPSRQTNRSCVPSRPSR